jgi:pimeloyl-ACP methyl ester carboxylesterase
MIGRRRVLSTALAASVPAHDAAATAKDVRFAGAGGIELAGTLLIPDRPAQQKVPGVVLIAGSGPTDRNGNNPGIPVKIDLLRQIAERLAQGGIASLRYDKRGIGASTSPPTNLAGQEMFFGWKNLIGDVQLAHAELIRHEEVKSYATALLGHSEGGLFAIATAHASIREPPYALVLASTPGRPMQDIIRSQLARAAPRFVDAAERVMTEIRRNGRTPADVPRPLAPLFPPYIGPFLKGELGFDPAVALASLKQPCLLLHGGADQQVVPMADIQPLVDALSRRSAPGEVLVAPLTSHNLKSVTGPADPGFAGPIEPAISDKLESWLSVTLGA